MEIRKVGRAALEQVKGKQDAPTEHISFSAVISQTKDQMNVDKLTRLVQNIEDQGKVLSESVSVEDLRKYKQLIKEFMDDAVKHGLKLEERRGFNRRGRTKVYKIVEEVDKKLLELTDLVLKKQEKGLRILDMVGEIKGMLINIYT